MQSCNRTRKFTQWIMRRENSGDISRRIPDWYGNRSVSVLLRNRKFSGRRKLFARSWPRSFPRFSVIYLVKSKSSGSTPLTTAPRTQVSQAARRIHFFSCHFLLPLPSFEMVIPYIFLLRLHSQFPPVPVSFQLFHTSLLPSFCLYKTVTVFQIHMNLMVSVSSVFPITRFLFYISTFQLFSLSLCRFIPIQVLLDYLLGWWFQDLPLYMRRLLVSTTGSGLYF